MPPPPPLPDLVQFCFVWPPYFPQSILADASCQCLTLEGGFVKPTCKIPLVRHICSSCYQTSLRANRTYHSFTDKFLFHHLAYIQAEVAFYKYMHLILSVKPDEAGGKGVCKGLPGSSIHINSSSERVLGLYQVWSWPENLIGNGQKVVSSSRFPCNAPFEYLLVLYSTNAHFVRYGALRFVQILPL